MSDQDSSASHGPAMPPEALQQGSMNQHMANFEKNKGDEPKSKATVFGTVPGGRQKFVKPSKHPLKAKMVKDLEGNMTEVTGLTRTDH